MTERDNERERLYYLFQENKCPMRFLDNKEILDTVDYLIANGVIVPPCKVGSVVYKVVNDKRVKKPYECKVIGFWYSEDENCNNVHLVKYVNDAFDWSFSVPFTSFGKTVFLTREEAEQALRKEDEGI